MVGSQRELHADRAVANFACHIGDGRPQRAVLGRWEAIESHARRLARRDETDRLCRNELGDRAQHPRGHDGRNSRSRGHERAGADFRKFADHAIGGGTHAMVIEFLAKALQLAAPASDRGLELGDARREVGEVRSGLSLLHDLLRAQPFDLEIGSLELGLPLHRVRAALEIVGI